MLKINDIGRALLKLYCIVSYLETKQLSVFFLRHGVFISVSYCHFVFRCIVLKVLLLTNHLLAYLLSCLQIIHASGVIVLFTGELCVTICTM